MTEQRTVNDFFMQQYFEKSVSLEQYSFKRPLVRVKALDDRKGSRSNDDLDHILGKKDRNWLNF